MCEATANGSAAFMYVHVGMSVCVYSIFFACGNSNIWHVIVVVSLALSAAIENVKGLESPIHTLRYIDKTQYRVIKTHMCVCASVAITVALSC